MIVLCFSLFEIINGTLEEIWSLWLIWLSLVAYKVGTPHLYLFQHYYWFLY